MSRFLLTLFAIQCLVNFSFAALAERKTRSVSEGGIPGAPVDVEDKYEPYYRALAEASLLEHQRSSGSAPLRLWSVDRVTEQYVSGTVFRIEFNAYDTRDVLHCNSTLWQQYSQQVDIEDIECHVIRPAIGDETEHDPTDPGVRDYAEKALQNYIQQSGNYGYFITRVEKATTALTSPPKDSIVFTAINSDSDVIHCYVNVIFVNKRDEILVDCKKSKRKYYS